MFRATSFFIVLLGILAITFLGTGGSGIIGGPGNFTSSPESLAAAQKTDDLLRTTEIPGRDLYDLAARLKGQDPAIQKTAARTTPLNRKVGDRDPFFVSKIAEKEYYTVTATVRDVSDHAYWYVADGIDVDTKLLQESADIFDNKIYPTDRRYFGSEWSPGIDGDTHVTVLIANIPGVGGYFTSSDEYPRSINPYSNEREMFYINAEYKPSGDHSAYDFFEGVLAHEFQHMIHWNMERDRDVWLDEGCAETAMSLNGYNVGDTDTVWINNPDTQLTTWADGKAALPHYGAAYLFVGYLMQHYGEADILTTLMSSPGSGAQAVSAALTKRGYTQQIEDVYKDWTIASYANDAAVGDGRFAYDAIKSKPALDRRIVRYPSSYNADVSQFGADYISLERGTGDIAINFSGTQEAKVLDTTTHSGTHFWYSNRRDTADTTLTQEFDLSSTAKATLNFWTWYNIEGDYDYGFVEASTDNGKSWTTLKGKYTTDTDPQGANYGNGYTGPSGHDPKSTDKPKWVQESMDLTPYAGKRVQLRFEMVTDEALNLPNWAVDDISIPEINYSSDAETGDDGWQAAGFVRITDDVPQRWHVAAIEYGRGTSISKIEEFNIDANQTGVLTVPGFGSTISRIVLVVGAMAPTTTEKSPYKFEIKRTN